MHNYYAVVESGDLRHLLILGKHDELPDVDCDFLADTWNGISEEVKQFAIDRSMSCANLFNLEKKIKIAKSDYDTIQVLLYRMWTLKDESYITALSELGYKINPKRDYHQELKRIEKQSKMLLSKIQLWESDPMLQQGDNTNTIYNEISHIERHINQIGSIDMRKFTMIQWLTLKYDINAEILKKKK